MLTATIFTILFTYSRHVSAFARGGSRSSLGMLQKRFSSLPHNNLEAKCSPRVITRSPQPRLQERRANLNSRPWRRMSAAVMFSSAASGTPNHNNISVAASSTDDIDEPVSIQTTDPALAKLLNIELIETETVSHPSKTSTDPSSNSNHLPRIGLVLTRNCSAEDNQGNSGKIELAWGVGRPKEAKGELPFSIDFVSREYFDRRKAANTEMVVRAMGGSIYNRTQMAVFDLTAGLARDAFVLASVGFEVTMFERNPVIRCLLEDALTRFKTIPHALDSTALAGRMRLGTADSLETLIRTLLESEPEKEKIGSSGSKRPGQEVSDNRSDTLQEWELLSGLKRPELVYIDPMYPCGYTGEKAAVKKPTKVLHRVVGSREGTDDRNNADLLWTALVIAGRRVVVKRPVNSPPLCGFPPDSNLKGSSQRFDVYNPERVKPEIMQSLRHRAGRSIA